MVINISQHTHLDEWTDQWIKKILDDNQNEDSLLEFKADLNSIDPKDKPEHNRSIRKAICSFANTKGGFLVFGIKDVGAGTGWERLCGIHSSKTFSKELTEKLEPKHVTPHIIFEGPKIISIDFQSNQYEVAIIKINESELKPHALLVNNGHFEFWIRGNQKAEPAHYSFLTKLVEESSQLRNFLAALYLDSQNVDLFCDRMLVPNEKRNKTTPYVQIRSLINSEQMHQFISRIPNDIDLVQIIWSLRFEIDLANNYRDMMIALRATAIDNKAESYENHNNAIAAIVPEIKKLTKNLRNHLLEKYAGVRDWMNVIFPKKP